MTRGNPGNPGKVCMSLDILSIGQKTLPIPSAILIEDKAAFSRIPLGINTLGIGDVMYTPRKP